MLIHYTNARITYPTRQTIERFMTEPGFLQNIKKGILLRHADHFSFPDFNKRKMKWPE